MSEKNQITVYGKIYKIKTDLDSVNPQDLADYVNAKMHELSSGKTKPSTIDLAILTALNIAGELFEVKGATKQEMTQKKSDQKEADQKVRHLVQMVEKELGRMQASRGSVYPRALNILLRKMLPRECRAQNHFLNLPRTGGISVNCFRLPPGRHAHHSQFRPLHFMLAQELMLYSSTTGKHNTLSF